jgi:hypothetical protein
MMDMLRFFQSPRDKVKNWSNGVLEWWNNGMTDSSANTPVLPYSSIPFHSTASEVFLSGLRIRVFQLGKPLG